MCSVEYAQFAQLMRPHILDELNIWPVWPGGGEIILKNPFAKRLGGDGHGISAADANGVGGGWSNSVYHRIWKAHIVPVDFEACRLCETGYCLLQVSAVFNAIVTAQNRNRAAARSEVVGNESDERLKGITVQI